MSDLNVVAICGRLTSDPELKFMTNGNAVCTTRIASSRKSKDKEYTTFVKCTFFGKLGEACAEWFKKGDQIILSGTLVFNEWEDKEGNRRSEHSIIGTTWSFGQKKRNKNRDESTERDDYESRDDEADIPF